MPVFLDEALVLCAPVASKAVALSAFAHSRLGEKPRRIADGQVERLVETAWLFAELPVARRRGARLESLSAPSCAAPAAARVLRKGASPRPCRR